VCRIFFALPAETQRKMLLDIVFNADDAVEKTR
jgi:hypothetical protein